MQNIVFLFNSYQSGFFEMLVITTLLLIIADYFFWIPIATHYRHTVLQIDCSQDWVIKMIRMHQLLWLFQQTKLCHQPIETAENCAYWSPEMGWQILQNGELHEQWQWHGDKQAIYHHWQGDKGWATEVTLTGIANWRVVSQQSLAILWQWQLVRENHCHQAYLPSWLDIPWTAILRMSQ